MAGFRARLSAIALCLALNPLTAHADWLEEARAAFADGDFATARELAEPMADAGDPAALNILGVLYFHGSGVAQDVDRGLDYYEAAVAQGHVIAMSNLAWIYYEGTNGSPRDPDRARNLAEAAAEAGNAEALNTLGVMAEEGAFGPPDYAAAAERYRLAMDGGSADGINNLGGLYARGLGVVQDDAQARLLFERAAGLDHGRGTRNLAYMMELGRGGPQDIPGAIATYRRAAALGYAVAANDLGILLLNGAAGLAPDPVGAAEAYVLGTELGHDWAPANLGFLLSDGDPLVPDDIDRAVSLYHLAYQRGNAEALSDLADMYRDGVGVSQDLVEAQRLLRVLADDGVPSAISDLGFMEEAGLLGPVDLGAAAELYGQAARLGYAHGGYNLATVLLNPDNPAADPVEGHAWCYWALMRETDPDLQASYEASCINLPETLSEADVEAIAARTEDLLTTY
jgi:TPR repeat protein